MNYKTLFENLVAILTNVFKNGVYGSVEIFFEKGRVTQITQRTIKKINHPAGHDDFDIKHAETMDDRIL